MRAIDSDGNLRADAKEVSDRMHYPRENDNFRIYNVLSQVKENFATAAGRDGQITGQEWSEFFDNNQSQ